MAWDFWKMAQGREKGTTAEREVGKKNGKIMVC